MGTKVVNPFNTPSAVVQRSTSIANVCLRCRRLVSTTQRSRYNLANALAGYCSGSDHGEAGAVEEVDAVAVPQFGQAHLGGAGQGLGDGPLPALHQGGAASGRGPGNRRGR